MKTIEYKGYTLKEGEDVDGVPCFHCFGKDNRFLITLPHSEKWAKRFVDICEEEEGLDA